MKEKQTIDVKGTFSYRADKKLVDKAREKVSRESKGKKTLSSKIEEMLYDYISR
jgi:hypothetical protein